MKDDFKLYNAMMGKLFTSYLAEKLNAEVLSQPVKKKEAHPLSQEEILSLIDMALETGDQEWFLELSERYKQLVVQA